MDPDPAAHGRGTHPQECCHSTANSPGGQDCEFVLTLSVPMFVQWQYSLYSADAMGDRRHFSEVAYTFCSKATCYVSLDGTVGSSL